MNLVDEVEMHVLNGSTAAARSVIARRRQELLAGCSAELLQARWSLRRRTGRDLFDDLDPSGSLVPPWVREVAGASGFFSEHIRGTTTHIPGGAVFGLAEGCQVAGGSFDRYLEAAKRALVDADCQRKVALGATAILAELGGNAVEHAKSPLAPVAYHQVEDNRWEIGLTDVGIGVRDSLCENPTWALQIEHGIDAMRLALRDGVSRSAEPGRGNGFRHVFKHLAERECALRFRSDDAVAEFRGAGASHTALTFQVLAGRDGFHASIAATITT